MTARNQLPINGNSLTADISYIITHPGSAHRDELLAVAVLLANHGKPLPIYRRNPTEAELADPQIAIMDCGNQHDPELMNFDHHQYQGGDCAFRLVMKHLGYHDVATELFPWYETTNDFDVLGPYATQKILGVGPDTVAALKSPLEEGILRLFGQMEVVESWLVKLLTQIGRGIIDKIFNLRFRMRELNEFASIITVQGVKGIFSTIENDPSLALNSFRMQTCPDATFSICPDDRGPGHILYRFDDDERIDFSRLAGDERIAFAHKGGFVAKTRERAVLDELAEIIGISVVSRV